MTHFGSSEPHLCSLYANEDERRRSLNGFVSEGIDRDQKVICALDNGQSEILLQDLAGAGYDADALVASGHLSILTADAAYLPNGTFDTGRGLQRIRTLIKQGVDEGFAGVRTAGDLGWLRQAPDFREAFFDYELEVNRLLDDHGSAALCMYPRSMLSTGDQLRCLSVHPVAQIKDEVLHNPFFLSPEGLRDRDPIEASLSWRRGAVRGVMEADRIRHLLSTVLDSVEAAVLVVDREGRTITECNQAALRMFGYRRSELIGLETRELHVDEDHWIEFGDASCRVLDGGHEYRGDFQMRRADGTIFPTRHVVTLLDPATGRAGGVVSTVRDRTDEVEARRRETETRARFRSMAESITDGVLTIDSDHRIIYANPAAHRMMGATEGMSLIELMPEEHRGRHRTAISRYLETGERTMSQLEMPLLRPDGTTFRAEISFGEYEVDGHHYVTEVIRDATERIHLEAQLRQSQKMEAVGRLASGVAHDFNNLLTVIRGSSELVRQDLPGDSPLQEDLKDVLEGVERAAALTRQLLAFSRSQVLEVRSVDLSELLTDIEPLLTRVTPSRIRLLIEKGAGAYPARGDSNELHRVLLNLVLNASDAIEGSGTIRLSLDTEDLTDADIAAWDGNGTLEAGRYFRLQVADDGAGIPANILDQVFDPFFTTKPEGSGTGLGLSSVLGIIQQMGGGVDVDSVLGEGTSFTLLIPEGADEDDAGEIREPDAEVERDGRGTILLVEDDEPLARVLVRALTREGHRVLFAPDGDEAVRMAQDMDEPIHIVLSDVVMPGTRGSELLETLRTHHPRIRLILMSGHGSSELAGQIPPDTEAFLSKPFSPQVLAKTVRRVLAGQG